MEQTEDAAGEEAYFVDVVDHKTEGKEKADWWIVTLKVNQSIVPFKLDTGSNVNIISFKEYNNLKVQPMLCPSKVRLIAYYGRDIPIHGQCRVSLEHKSQKYQTMLIVASSDMLLILRLGNV